MADQNEATLPSHYVQAFEANMGLLPQQTQSRLVSRVDSNLNFTKPGDMFNADDMGTSAPKEIEDRFGVSPEGSVDKRRRVGFFVPYDDGKFVDDVDAAKSLSDPTNPTMMAMMAGHERYRDKAIIDGLIGPAREGRNGENVVAFPAAQAIAINDWDYYDLSLPAAPAGNSALTVAKLIKAKVKLDAAEIDDAMPGMPTFVTSAEQLGQLLRDKQLTSNDFNAVKALVNGEVNTFMGFEFVRSQQTPKAGGVRTSIAFKKGALMYRGRKLTDAKISQRADRKFNWYAYYKGMHGTLRRHDTGVVTIACVEA